MKETRKRREEKGTIDASVAPRLLLLLLLLS
jgi:hypothetical protein